MYFDSLNEIVDTAKSIRSSKNILDNPLIEVKLESYGKYFLIVGNKRYHEEYHAYHYVLQMRDDSPKLKGTLNHA